MSILRFSPAPAREPDSAPDRSDVVVETYLQLLGARDPELRAHAEAVAETSVAVAAEVGLPASRIGRLRRAALMHDVGKLAVPDAVLLKPGPLTEAERDQVTAHSTWGHRIAMHAEMLAEARWILHHHERPDGRGYPYGLGGEEIPVESRVILVADAFDAMTNERPYSRAMTPQRALEQIEQGAGTQFDPDCASALVAIFS
jgi:HD-GYP domain-containing protein (c-di-GMP phosphodiesterase class II)